MKSSLLTDEETEARPRPRKVWERSNSPSLPTECKSTFSEGPLPFTPRENGKGGKAEGYLSPKNILIPNSAWHRKDPPDT